MGLRLDDRNEALWVAVIAGAIWAVVTLVRRDNAPREAPSAREELDSRLPRGEITEDEYKRRRDLIGSAS